MKLKDAVTLLRPRHWIKNTFVLLPLLAAGKFVEFSFTLAAFHAALVFCLAASLVYVFNDLVDADNDRQHPAKEKLRPIAAGRVTPRHGVAILALVAVALAVAMLTFPRVWLPVSVYVAINILYTVRLKHEPVLDIFTIATGFVLRMYAGAAAIGVELSPWMMTTGFCLSLYLAAVKRRQELVSQNGSATRKVLHHYSVALIDRYAEMAATGTIIFYSLFIMTAHPELVITVPLVLYGLFRYWFIVEIHKGGESPTDVLIGDWRLMGSVALWAALYIFSLLPGAAGHA